MPIARNSKQRTAIFSELSSRCDHPTADELYQSVKKDFPSISLGTVYRNLKQLSEDGQILCINGENADHFDADMKPHYHLYCLKCQRFYDLNMPEIPNIVSAAKSNFKGSIKNYTLIYKGTCENCAAT